MIGNDDFMKFLAAWLLVHESADEGVKAAIARGEGQTAGEMTGGPGAFVDGLAAMVEVEKEKLKAELSAGETGAGSTGGPVSEQIAELQFEVAELRGRIESMSAVLDTIAASVVPRS